MKRLKYFGAILLSTTVVVAFEFNGVLTYLPLLFSFGFIPVLELFFKPNANNLNVEQRKAYATNPYFKWLLYSIVPLQFFFVYYFLTVISDPLETYELVGRITSLGVLCGIFGINVGHELGHRSNRFDRLLGELLLLTSLETHFLPFHNKGHHYYVATPKDPATARRNESVFKFWLRSQFGSYIQAWKIESRAMTNKGRSVFTLHHRMLWYTIAQLLLLLFIYFMFGLLPMLAFIGAAIVGIMMLETVNYIEHYGLQRQLKESGNYERVQPWHSWNSDHEVGRSILFELSRHSDHHYKASKPYQLLDSMPDSPQMITGYPGMMVLALIPPLWFKLMHREMKKYNS
jgi:alkane 1-monooxygenase